MKNLPVVASYPGDEFKLDLPSGNFDKDAFVTIWKEELDGEMLYHVGPQAVQLNKPARLSISYADVMKHTANPVHLAIYVQNAESMSWEEIPSMIDRQENKIVAEIDKLGTFKIGFNENTLSPDMDAVNSLSENFVVSPNPFSGQTLLCYNNAKEGRVQISIYDLAGNIISTVLNEYQPEGDHSFILSGTTLKNGIYICRITTAEGELIKRLVKVE
jgi:hypothetical protein